MGRGYDLADENVVQVASLGPSTEVESVDAIDSFGDWTSRQPSKNPDIYRSQTTEPSLVVPVVFTPKTENPSNRVANLCDDYTAVLIVEDTANPDDDLEDRTIVYHESEEGDIEEGELDIVWYQADVFDRIEGLVDTDYLTEKTVTVVGLGTGGSRCAVELAKAGVGEFHLVDYDRLETHNITRHECGLSDIGRLKINAVRDTISEKNPGTEVHVHPLNVVEQREQFREVVAASDIVVGATDSDLSKLVTNKLCLDEDIPAVYAGAYERGFGGDVIRVIPGETACYDCVLGELQSELDYAGSDTEIDYTETEDPTEVSAEPGLSTDVGFISLIQTKFVLSTLLRGTNSEFETYDENMLFWGTKPKWIFNTPFQSQFAETTIREECETCQQESFYESKLGMSPDEVQAEAEQILDETETLDGDVI